MNKGFPVILVTSAAALLLLSSCKRNPDHQAWHDCREAVQERLGNMDRITVEFETSFVNEIDDQHGRLFDVRMPIDSPDDEAMGISRAYACLVRFVPDGGESEASGEYIIEDISVLR